MVFDGSVSEWIGQLQSGEEAALGRLQKRYWPYLVNLARKRLRDTPARAADEEDVAQEAFWAFYRSLKAGQLPRLNNRNDLWALLTHIVGCRAVNQIQHELGVQKRGGGLVRGGSAFDLSGEERFEPADPDGQSPLEQAILADCYRQYLHVLPEPLRPFAELHLAGLTNKEVAQRQNCTERTVERKLALIVQKWQTMAAASLLESARRDAV